VRGSGSKWHDWHGWHGLFGVVSLRGLGPQPWRVAEGYPPSPCQPCHLRQRSPSRGREHGQQRGRGPDDSPSWGVRTPAQRRSMRPSGQASTSPGGGSRSRTRQRTRRSAGRGMVVGGAVPGGDALDPTRGVGPNRVPIGSEIHRFGLGREGDRRSEGDRGASTSGLGLFPSVEEEDGQDHRAVEDAAPVVRHPLGEQHRDQHDQHDRTRQYPNIVAAST
jgi:hypothetical protein